MSKIEWFRQVSAVRPDIGERVMISWGRAELPGYFREVLACVQPGKDGWSEALSEVVRALRDLHHQEFPELPASDEAAVAEMLAANADFRRVNERFPHIGQRILALWGQPPFTAYLQELEHDTRDGKRTGFPPEVLFALFALQETHNREFPALAPKLTDIWTVGGGV